MIAVKNLKKSYGETCVVDDVSFKLPTEQIIAFIGGNGAGKSTILSIISRLIKNEYGEVHIDDMPLEEWSDSELSKKLSILSQSNHLNVRLTVQELIAFGRFPHSKGKLNDIDKAHIQDAIAFTGLEKYAGRYLDELSGGQRQMAFIAMLIAQDTKYILLDEPLNNLDMKRSTHIMKMLKKLVREKGQTIIVVIHDINFVSCYADYIVAVKDGQICTAGTVEEVMQPQILEDVYDMPIDIQKISGNNICLYYT